MVVWKDFQPLHVLESIWDTYIHYMMSKSFLRWLQSGAEIRTKEIHGFITMHIDRSILFVSHAKQMLRFYFIRYYFIIVVLYENV
jgi:hypothetical protein